MRQIDDLVQRLRQHFEAVTIHPPASDAILGRLYRELPAVPDSLLSFWRYCDGIEVANDDDGILLGVEQSLSSYPYSRGGLGRFVPLRSDGCGDYDCLVVGDGPCHGAVVFSDQAYDEGPAYLVGGSLLSYLDMWADNMVHNFLPNGKRDPRSIPPNLDSWPWLGTPEYEHPWPFDEAWMRRRDPTADKLLRDEWSRGWLVRQNHL